MHRSDKNIMLKKIVSFYKISVPTTPYQGDEHSQKKYYNRLRWSSFLSGTVGYSLYYVCRTSLNVVKKPIMDSGILDAHQLGIIGSALLFSYAIGKFVNSFMADHSNIKRFMATGLIVSAIANISIGLLGIIHTSILPISSFLFFVFFAVMWGINGWAQSMGAAPAIIALSRWFPLKVRGTFYGFFSASHNMGEFLSFIFVGTVVSIVGWQWGFVSSSIAGIVGVMVIILFLHDNPESKGLPPVEIISKEIKTAGETEKKSISKSQLSVLSNPYVWILALSSSFMYVSRYAINSWGVLFLQESKGFSLTTATQIISINALLGVVGTVFSGWISDKLFKGKRNMMALLFGVLNTISLCLFIYGGNSMFVNILSMVLFGLAMGILICFLGGLMAVDIVPRNASGAALGIVGVFSYMGAGIQDIVSGYLIESQKTTVNGVTVYSFDQAALCWIGASVLSFVLALFVWNAKKEES